jgi:hypothetical protein
MPARHSRQATQLNRRTVDVSRAAFAIFGLALVLAVGLALLGTRPVSVAAPTPSESDAEVRTGTILLAPNHDNICRQLTFDNGSGRMRDAGSVPCGGVVAEAALVRAERPLTHFDTIREAFRNR